MCPRIGDVDDEPTGAADTSDEDAGWDDDATEEARRRRGAPPARLTGVYAMLSTLRATPALGVVRIGVLHGRLDPDAKDATMRAFSAARSTCSWRRPSSRSASTCRTPRSWSSSTPTASASPSCTSSAAASAVVRCPASACS